MLCTSDIRKSNVFIFCKLSLLNISFFVLKAWQSDSLDLDMKSVYLPTFPVKLSWLILTVIYTAFFPVFSSIFYS